MGSILVKYTVFIFMQCCNTFGFFHPSPRSECFSWMEPLIEHNYSQVCVMKCLFFLFIVFVGAFLQTFHSFCLFLVVLQSQHKAVIILSVQSELSSEVATFMDLGTQTLRNSGPHSWFISRGIDVLFSISFSGECDSFVP